MKRKALFIVLTFTLILFIATISFATNDVKNGISNVTNTMVDGASRLGNDVKNGINNAAGAVENGAKNLGNAMSNGMQNIDNDMNTDYNAIRTTAADMTGTNGNTTNPNIWTWVAVAVAGIVIVGLVWYYAVEHDTER